MNVLEKVMVNQLTELRETYHLIGIKTEFEAEGALMEDVIRLREITLRAGVDVVMKIGGCEAITDIRNARVLGVDEIVVPVTESPFAVKKFVGAVNFVYLKEELEDLKLLINVETIDGVRNFDQILALPEIERIAGLDIGRVDLALSLGFPPGEASHDKVFEVCTELCRKMKRRSPEKPCILGGPLDLATIGFLKRFNLDLIDGCESKKVIFDAAVIRENRLEEAFLKGIEFERTWFQNRSSYYAKLAAEDQKAIGSYNAAHETIKKALEPA